MNWGFNLNTPKSNDPEVVSGGGFTYLHFNDGNFQSLMNTSQPDWLELGYTRTMMGFLLFHPEPAHIAMIGLGGGSLSKFCYRHLPQARITTVEINPDVIALRQHFHIPEDDARFEIVCGDGAAYVAAHQAAFDVVLVDGFDATGQPPQLCSQSFYDAAYASLSEHGVLVVNVLGADPLFEEYLSRLLHRFGDTVVVVTSEDCANKIVFALKGDAAYGSAAEWLARAEQLQEQYGLDFRRIVAAIYAATDAA